MLVVAEQLRVSATPSAASKLSLMTVGQLAVMDCYSCLMHLTSGTPQPTVAKRLSSCHARL